MKQLWASLFCGVWLSICCLPVASAQTLTKSLILSKDAGGTLVSNALNLALRANSTCDQTGEAFPDDTRLLAEDLEFVLDGNRLGTVHGSVRLVAPDGQLLQVMTLRGTYGLNTRRDANKDCRFGHLEALLEPVPTFAPPPIPQIALASLSADVIPEAAGPLPVYRAKLDGVVTLPPESGGRVTLSTDKGNYSTADAITAVLTNGLNQPITVFDLKSYCTIVRLQRQEGGSWVNVGECLLRRASLPVTIGTSESRRVTLLPGPNTSTQRQPGVYRLLVEYHLGSGSTVARETTSVVSPVFRIGSQPVRQGVKVLIEELPEFTGQGFVVRVINDTEMAIQTEDHKTDCTILDLQRQENSDWTKVAQCPLLTPTRLIRIEPRQSQSIKLPASGATVYPPGTYRVEFSYQVLNPQGPSGQTVSAVMFAYSPEFALRQR